MDISGSLSGPGLRVRATGTDLGFGDIHLGNISVVSNLLPSGFLEVESLSLDNRGSKLTGHGRIGILEAGREPGTGPPVEFTLRMADVEARDFVQDETTDGTLNGTLAISGYLNALEAAISLDGEKIALKQARIGDVHAEARLESGTVFLEALQVTNGRSRLTMQGEARVLEPDRLRVLSPPTFDLELSGDRIFAEDFTDRIKGTFSVDARIGGSSLAPEGSATLRGTNVDLGFQKLHSIAIASSASKKEVILDAFTIRISETESLSGTGRFKMPGLYEIELLSDGISLSSIDSLKALSQVDGKIILSLEGKGHLDDPAVTGNIRIQDLQVNQNMAQDISIRLDLKDHLARVVAQSDFDLKASYHLKKRDFSSNVAFQKTDLSPYMAMAGQNDFTGSLSGRITAEGNAADPKGIHAEAAIDRLDVAYQDTDLAGIQDALLKLEEETLSIANLTLVLPKDGYLDVAGQAALDGPLDLEIEGDLPVSIAGLFLEDMADADGQVSLSADVSGSFPDPGIQADVAFRGIQMTLPVLMQKLHGLNGKLAVSRDGIQIRNMAGRLDTGTFAIQGDVTLADFRPARMDVDIATDRLPVNVPDTVDMLLGSEIQIKGDADGSVVSGDLVVLEGTYYKDVTLSMGDIVGAKRRRASAAPSEAKDPFLENMVLDLHVYRRNPFIVDNNLAYLDINPDLRISGPVYAPVMSGRAAIESGTVFYQKNSFVVKKGVVDFINPYEIEPTLDLESEVAVRDWLITLSISGTPDAMVFKLASDPPEDDSDILSLLLIGKTTKELIAGEDGTSQSPSQIIIALAAATLGEGVKQATGLDVFEFEASGTENVKITIGKELSRRLMVKYATEMKDGENVQRAIGEYKLTDRILLNGFQDTTGVFGGEIQFRMEFR